MRTRLLWKILLLNLPVLATVILVIWLAIDYLAADYFMALMEDYDVSPTDAHRMFVDSIHRHLIGAGFAAFAIAGGVSFLLTRRLLEPLKQVTRTITAMSSGSRTARVRSTTNDELGDLASAFNRMAGNIERLENLRRNMLIDVAHDLRTPLTNIRGYMEGIDDGVIEPDRQILSIIHEEALHLTRLVENVLDLARADAAGPTLQTTNVVIADVIDDAIDHYQPQLLSRKLSVNIRIADGVEVVEADREKLLCILMNLLQNACQYAHTGGKVDIEAAREQCRIRFCVTNTGSGISRGDLPLIFERFYRGDKSRSRRDGRTGIGLSIVKSLVEAHGGTVGAHSVEGSTGVWFTLPLEPTRSNSLRNL